MFLIVVGILACCCLGGRGSSGGNSGGYSGGNSGGNDYYETQRENQRRWGEEIAMRESARQNANPY